VLRKLTLSSFKLPKVTATRTTMLHNIVRYLVPQPAKSSDKQLARTQTFVLCSGFSNSVLENWFKGGIYRCFIGSCRVNWQCYCVNFAPHEAEAMNKNLTHLVKKDGDFTAAARNLFREDFTKKAMDELD
jgi:hypothetical protein